MDLNHFDKNGKAVMVDVSGKTETKRIALASGTITMSAGAFNAVKNGTAKKGDVIGAARIAGIMALKRTAELLPMCHTLLIENASLDFTLDEVLCAVKVICTVKTTGKTGVEMEALTGASVALLTVYDMCKALDKGMLISNICLQKKSGGKSGDYERQL